jgi:predicted outer membrane repeat protein
VTYSDIQGGYEGDGNIAVDPLFVDPGSGDFHLSPGSPCIDVGTNNTPNLPAYDFEGDPRAMDGNSDWTVVVDMGIDELLGIPPNVIYVDQDAAGGNNGTSWEDAYTDLQPALEDAADADGIWVAEGTYTPTYRFSAGDPRSATFQLGNGVALYGGFDPTVGDVGWDDRDWVSNITILSGDIGSEGDPGDNSYHVFYHPPKLALDGSAVLDGFTVTGGNANGEPAPNNLGGGMYNKGSSPAVTNCTFSGNLAGNSGGGMSNSYSSPAVTNCTFSGNSASWGGGAMSNSYSSPTLTNCTLSGNSADQLGGGMSNSSSSPTLTNCTLSWNSAGNSGGGLYNDSSSPAVTNCTFLGNSADQFGGGMYNDSSSPTATNCTFSGNTAVLSGGGMQNHGSSFPALNNCILWGDSPDEIYSYGGEVVTYSDIQGGYDGTGNIDTDPLFADPGGGDYHLGPGSLCIDAGTNHSPNLTDFDFEGDRRIMDGNSDGTAVVDMGVDEVWGPPLDVIYVDQDAVGYSNGTSWEDALTDLQHALALAVDGVEIWVAEGTYTPTYRFSAGDPRSATFQLRNGVTLYGGFDPTVGDVGWDDRDWVGNATILSGDVGTTGEPDDNSYHVFYHPAELALDDSAVLDGFTLTGANANGSNPHDRGGGMHNYRSSPSVINSTFSGNSAEDYGGGMANFYSSPVVSDCTFSGNSARIGGGMFNHSSSSPTVTDCTFSGNSASEGGGMFNYDSCSPTVADCTFLDNSASWGGGGMFFVLSRSLVTNCTFSGNSAGDRGGGMYTNASGMLEVTNCVFTGNSAREGGGMHNASSSPSVINSTFSGNSAEDYGGGMSSYESSSPLTNCILWGDSLPEIYNFGDREPVVTYTNVQGGYDGEGNIDADPLFVDPGNGDYHLGPGSPCIDTGTNDAPNLPAYDFEGHPRVFDGDGDGTAVVDMGVDEVARYVLYLPLVFRGY